MYKVIGFLGSEFADTLTHPIKYKDHVTLSKKNSCRQKLSRDNDRKETETNPSWVLGAV